MALGTLVPINIDVEPQLGVPRDVAMQIKEIASKYPLAWRFITDDLCLARRQSFIGVEDIASVLCWREGRRFVGVALLGIQARPMTEADNLPPAARTVTEKVRRRNKSTIRG